MGGQKNILGSHFLFLSKNLSGSLHSKTNKFLTLMLLAANFANTKLCK